jgi:hypothetical protein
MGTSMESILKNNTLAHFNTTSLRNIVVNDTTLEFTWLPAPFTATDIVFELPLQALAEPYINLSPNDLTLHAVDTHELAKRLQFVQIQSLIEGTHFANLSATIHNAGEVRLWHT